VLGLIRYYGYSGGLFFVKFEKIWKNLEKFGKTVGLYRGQLLPNDGQEPRLRGGEVEIWGGGVGWEGGGRFWPNQLMMFRIHEEGCIQKYGRKQNR
jgi:hypothetical protein